MYYYYGILAALVILLACLILARLTLLLMEEQGGFEPGDLGSNTKWQPSGYDYEHERNSRLENLKDGLFLSFALPLVLLRERAVQSWRRFRDRWDYYTRW